HPDLPDCVDRAPLRHHGRVAHRAAVGPVRPPGGVGVVPRAVPLVALAVLFVLPAVLPAFLVVVLTEIAIVALFATAFNLLMGFGGMVSFGHAAYFALGAYAAAILVKQVGVPMLVGLAAAPIVAAIGAFVFGFFIVRLTHTYFAM